MSKRSRAARASDSAQSGIDRRTFLGATALALVAPRIAFAEPALAAPTLPEPALQQLGTSKFVYVSPLKKDGSESTCHGEVWFAWLDGCVLVNSRRGTWKVKAIQSGLDRARIWAGDYGRWKAPLGGTPSDAFRKGPTFDAHASFETDRKWNDQLIALYDTKYGDDFARWHEDMQTGFYSGQRMLIRYKPV
jgi:hypothetical protein